jgi:ABC-type transport system involved in cytochrome c biogenesis permease subunit
VNTLILSIATFVYLSAFVVLLITAVSSRGIFDRAGRLIMILGFSLQSIGIALRWIESYRAGIGHAPLSNFYESLVFFSWAVVLLSLVFLKGGQGTLGRVFVTALAFLLMAYASFSPGVDSRIQPLIPALKSNWLIVHVITCFLGYAAFFMASVMGIILLVKGESAEEAGMLGDMLYRSTATGFILFTFGIVTGSVWAYAAWGRYWGWDPKETWALITWLIYSAVLHVRIRERRVSTKVAAMTLIGLASVLFTYFGVNYLPGLHSYR